MSRRFPSVGRQAGFYVRQCLVEDGGFSLAWTLFPGTAVRKESLPLRPILLQYYEAILLCLRFVGGTTQKQTKCQYVGLLHVYI